jgi:uncharacterized Zn finger protein (UPF0148 family)
MKGEDREPPSGERVLVNLEDLRDNGQVVCPLCNRVGEFGALVGVPYPLGEMTGLLICRRCGNLLGARRRGISEAEVEKERQQESRERQMFVDARMEATLLARGKQDFESLEDANIALEEILQEWNRTPRPRLGGLSPNDIMACKEPPEQHPNAGDTIRKVRASLQDPAAAAVADRLLAEMDEYSEQERATALTIWRDFCRKRRINARAEASWAAGVEYAVCRLALYEGTTQAAVGEKYGVSAGTVAARFAEIRNTLRIKQFDRRYMLAVDEWVMQGAMFRSSGLPFLDWRI